MDFPDPPARHPYTLLRRDGFAIGSFPDASYGLVEPQAVTEDGIEGMVLEARALLAGLGKQQGAWFVAEACQPEGLAARLRLFGMVPYEEPPLEPRFAAMALLREPPPGPPDVDAHPAASLAEYKAGRQVSDDAFEMSETDRQAFETQAALLFELERDGSAESRTFVALLDNEIAGFAFAIYGASSVYLGGGATHQDKRGRGVYRALVRARWDAAVAHGTPALTVGAGTHSGPILERLGFQTVGWVDCLLDRFA
jgi:hypothetical protein